MKATLIRFVNLPGVGITLFCAALVVTTVLAFAILAIVLTF